MINLEMARSIHAMPSQAIPMAEGDQGVEQTIAQMRRLIEHGKKDPVIHELAARILRTYNVRAFDWIGEARAIFNWVRECIRFTRDIYGKETLHAAREIVRLGIGDCDDFTILICSLCGTVGMKTRIVTVSNHAEDPSQFSHVFPEAYLNGQWTPLDAARRDPAFGRGPRNYFRKRVWDTTSDEYQDIAGLSGPAGPGPNALPGAYTPGVPDIRFRRLRGLAYIGQGHYGVPALRRMRRNGMGDLISTLPQDITAAGTEAANIIAASRAAPTNLIPTTNASQLPAFNASLTTAFPGSTSLVAGGISTGTLLLFGIGAIALFAISRR